MTSIIPSTITDELYVTDNSNKKNCYTAYPKKVVTRCYESIGKCRYPDNSITGQNPSSDHKCNTCQSGQVLTDNYTRCVSKSCPPTYSLNVQNKTCDRTNVDTTPAIIN